MSGELLTVPQAAAALQVHPETVRRLIRRGELPADKVGSLWRVPVYAVERHEPAPSKRRAPRPVEAGREATGRVRARRREERTGESNA